jgi:hypothetical protein
MALDHERRRCGGCDDEDTEDLRLAVELWQPGRQRKTRNAGQRLLKSWH